MTPDLLRECGEALYGPLWQSALARDLAVSDRTMRRWAAGEFNIPPTIANELYDLLLIRGKEIEAVMEKFMLPAGVEDLTS